MIRNLKVLSQQIHTHTHTQTHTHACKILYDVCMNTQNAGKTQIDAITHPDQGSKGIRL